MPMLDAYIPADALPADDERKLLSRATDLLLENEGVDPTNPQARAIAWIFVHHPTVFVAGAPADKPRYRFICQVPEGQYNDERRQATTAAMTEAVIEAEAGRYGDDTAARVWVFTYEVPDGTWGGLGAVVRLPDIADFVAGPEGRAAAEQLLADRRRAAARRMLDAAREPRQRLTAGPRRLLPAGTAGCGGTRIRCPRSRSPRPQRLRRRRSCSRAGACGPAATSGVISTSSSSAMNSIAVSMVSTRGGVELDGLVGGVGADVGLLLLADDVDDHVAGPGVLAHDHALVDLARPGR